MDDSDSPSPTSTVPSEPLDRDDHSHRSTRSRRHHRDGKERDRSSMTSYSKELAKVLVRQEGEVKDLRNRLYVTEERLKDEIQRADDAEKRVMDAVLKFKEANDARLAAQQDSSRLSEELKLYKIQLDAAQKEIFKAQEILDSLEEQKNAAEEAASRARDTARKLREEKMVFLAREEGRQQGYKEGIAQGRAMGYEEGRNVGFSRSRSSPRSTRAAPVDVPMADYIVDPSPPRDPSSSTSSSSSSARIIVPPGPRFDGSEPEDIHIRNSPASSGPLNMKNIESYPVMVQNVAIGSPTNVAVEYPPDGWVPEMDGDGRVRLPPPHEFAPSLSRPVTPGTPGTSPSAPAALKVAEELDGMKMIPPPFQTPKHAKVTLSDIESRATAPTNMKRPAPRRRNSEESQSTTMSQFEILGAPTIQSKHVERPNVLSAIVEEKERSSTISSPPNGTSPYQNGLTPHSLHPGLGTSSPNIYVRPRSHSSLSDAGNLNMMAPPMSPPSRSQSRSRPSPKGSFSSDAGIAIDVEPPSRTDSQSGLSPSRLSQPDLLSAIDAESFPPVPPPIADPAPPSAGHPTPGLAPLTGMTGMPMELPTDGLPAGFMPMGPPTPVGYSEPMYTNPMTPAAVPLPPSTVPSAHPLSARTPSAVGSNLPGGYFQTPGPNHASVDPVVIPLPSSSTLTSAHLQSGRYSRAALQQDSSDDPVSSSFSDSDSMDSLTTPPQRYRKTPGPTYATAPTPPGVTYTLPPPTPGGARSNVSVGSKTGSVRNAAKVPLPPSTVGGSPAMSNYTKMSKRGGSAVGSLRG